MIFRDYTLVQGRVSSRQTVDNRELAAPAVTLAGRMLREARATGAAVPHGIAGMPGFTLRLGMPAEFADAPGNELVFTVGEPGEPAFQFNCVVHADSDRDAALFGMSTIVAISLAAQRRNAAEVTENEIAETVEPLYDLRPIVVSAVLPTVELLAAPARLRMTDPEVIFIAADFAKCAAAAWLLEGP